MGISEHALRRRIRAHLGSNDTATFHGVHAQRLGRRYLVRLSARWLSDPVSSDAD